MFIEIPALYIGKPGEWILAGQMVYKLDDGRLIVLPKGFISDLATIPWLITFLIRRNGANRLAAILHDWLYSNLDEYPYTRAQADSLFRQAMAWTSVPAWERWLIWLGVRVGGWAFFYNWKNIFKGII